MKKQLSYILCLLLTSALYSCRSNETSPAEPSTQTITTTIVESTIQPTTVTTDNTTAPATTTDNGLSELEAIGDIEVDKGLFSVTLNIPADFVDEGTTQETLDEIVKEKGYKSATLNADGSVSYVMTQKQHQEMLESLSENLNNTLSEMVGSESTPNITAIEANENFTDFKVTTTNNELSLSESFSVMTFYVYGGMYATFSGETVDNIHVDFINASSGEIIESANSSDANE